MSLGRSRKQQRNQWIASDQLPQSKGPVLYERLQKFCARKALMTMSKSCDPPFYAKKNQPLLHSVGQFFPHAADWRFWRHGI